MRPLAHRDLFLPAVTGVIALAWVALGTWERSPYGRYLDHAELGGVGAAGGLAVLAHATLYVAGWTLMTVAMMLPTTLPLVQIFRRLTFDHAQHGRLVALLLVGYLGIWVAFGIGAHVLDWGLHQAVERSPWLHARPWLFGAGLLLVAGAFQFSRLKYRCLDQCRSPLSFVMGHWRGPRPRIEALWLGVHHGLFCVGCCWALMLLMFAVGTGNVGWMLGLGAVMAVEKNMPWGRKLSAPVGAALLAGGAVIVLRHAWAWLA